MRSAGDKIGSGNLTSNVNARTHLLWAETIEFLPNQDADAFAARIDVWNRDLDLISGVEAHLARHAAVIAWKRARAERTQIARAERTQFPTWLLVKIVIMLKGGIDQVEG